MQRSQIFVQNRVFCLPRLHSTPSLGGFPSEYRHPAWHGKLEWLGYTTVKKFWRYVYSFSYDTRTWQTDRQTPHADIGRAYAKNNVKQRVFLGRLLVALKIIGRVVCWLWKVPVLVLADVPSDVLLPSRMHTTAFSIDQQLRRFVICLICHFDALHQVAGVADGHVSCTMYTHSCSSRHIL